MKKTTKIDVKPTTELVINHEIAFGRMDMNPVQMDVMALLLAEIGKETDEDTQRNYTLTANQFKSIKQYKDKHEVYKTMKERVTGKDKLVHTSLVVKRSEEDMESYAWFTSVRYFNGSLILHVNPDIKEMLVELKKSDEYKVFAALQYLLPMKSFYSKRIYLMCRNFVTSGKIYPIKWDEFKTMLAISKGYSDSMIKTRVLDKAVEEIEKYTDLSISYTLHYESGYGRGGKHVSDVAFAVKRKKKEPKLTEKQKKAIEMKAAGVQPDPKKAKAKKNAFNDFEQREYDYDELERQLTGH